jgi:hypothetical protein
MIFFFVKCFILLFFSKNLYFKKVFMKYLVMILFFTGSFINVFASDKTCLWQMDKTFEKILEKNRLDSYKILNSEYISQKKKWILMAMNYRIYKCNMDYMWKVMKLKSTGWVLKIPKWILCPKIDQNLFKEFAWYCGNINYTDKMINNGKSFLDKKKIAILKRREEVRQNFKRWTKNILYDLYNKKIKSLSDKMQIMWDDMWEIADSFNYTFKKVSCIGK